MRYHKYVLMLLPAFFSLQVFSADLEEFIGAERVLQLVRDGHISMVQQKNPHAALMPADDALHRIVNKAMETLNPSVIAESLFLYEKPVGYSFSWSRLERTALYNGILSLSTLKGIEYFSLSRNKKRVLYETSTIIDGPDTKNPLPDPHYPIPPAELTVYARQKDTTFGDNIYRYTFYAQSDSLIFVQQNLSDMHYGIVRIAGKEKLHAVAAVFDAGDCLLIYTVSMVKTASLFGMGQQIGASFINRAEAILGWFSGHADKVFGK